jgi:hypothetical protein
MNIHSCTIPFYVAWRLQREGFVRSAVAYSLNLRIDRFFVHGTLLQNFNFPAGFAHFQFTCYCTYPLTGHTLLHTANYNSHITSNSQLQFTYYFTQPIIIHILLHTANYNSHIISHSQLQFTYYFTKPIIIHILLHTANYNSHITSHIHLHFTYFFTHAHSFYTLPRIPSCT